MSKSENIFLDSCLKREFKNQSKKVNSEKPKRFKTSKSEYSKIWEGESENILDVMRKTRSSLLFYIILKRAVHSFKIQLLFKMIIFYRYNEGLY